MAVRGDRGDGKSIGERLGREVRLELAGRHTELGLFVSTSVLSFVKVSDRSFSFSTLHCTHLCRAKPPVVMDEKYIDDDAQLAQMGHKAELKRHFSLLYVYHFWACWCLTAELILGVSFLGRCWVSLLPFSTYVSC